MRGHPPVALAGWWYAVPQMARMMHADTTTSPKQALTQAAIALATPDH